MNEHYPFQLEPLPYPTDALEPYICKEIVELHHYKHQQTYVDTLNGILVNYPELQEMSLEELITEQALLPDEVKTKIKNNAGGVYNHQLYFNCMNNPSMELPTGALAQEINKSFGSMDSFRSQLSNAAITQFGSGYAWLLLTNGKLDIISTPNQDTPLADNVLPLLCIDVWEHAYYLQYQNRRADYVENWFSLINWGFVEKKYTLNT